jgi:hypothetical protein
MDDGQCEAGLMTREDFDALADICRLALVGDPKFAVPRGIPVSERFYRALFKESMEYESLGGWLRALSAVGRRLASSKAISAAVADDGDLLKAQCNVSNSGEADGMPPHAMIGPLAITFVLCCAGIVQNFLSRDFIAVPVQERVINPVEEHAEKIYEAFEGKLHSALGDHLSKYRDVLIEELEHRFSKGHGASDFMSHHTSTSVMGDYPKKILHI